MPGRAHLQDETRFLASLQDGTLPAVSYIKPLGIYDEHAGYSDVEAAEKHAVDLIEAVKSSPYWERAAMIVTYDDFGGWRRSSSHPGRGAASSTAPPTTTPRS